MRETGGPTRRDFVRQASALAGISAAGVSFRAAATPAAEAVRASVEGDRLVLDNGAIRAEWSAGSAGPRLLRIEDRRNGRTLTSSRGAFALRLDGGELLDASDLRATGPATVEELSELPAGPAAAEPGVRTGRRISLELTDDTGRFRVVWRTVLRADSGYVRQEIALTAKADLPLREVTLVDLDVPAAAVCGTVPGSPLTAGSWFFGFEHPLAVSTAGRRARSALARELPLRSGQTIGYSSVVGAARDGQLRRDFLAYIERERARPYAPFLHYNSWYDLGYFTSFDESAALAVIEAFGRELHEKRGVVLDSFLFDDGWDDHRFWGFHAGFPRGFAPLADATARYGAAPGVWLSPWGGYGKPRQERLAFAREQGFETNENGLALSGPVYYRRFREVCLEFLRKYRVNQFKLDGTGSSTTVVPGSAFGSDFEAAIALIRDLRAEKPGLYVNLTTGTYPSPFWLRHADSIWRGGEDHDFAGVGSARQRWITYRDADTFSGVVQRGPLFPLNSLMLHGLIFAKHARDLDADPGGDFRAEIRSYFGSGTQLQELYVTPALLSPADWDAVAEAAQWARASAPTLADTHWVGGDPARREVYGWAAWSPGRGILTLRNPAPRRQTLEVDAARVFELPSSRSGRFRARRPWRSDRDRPAVQLEAGRSVEIALEPFEVATFVAEI